MNPYLLSGREVTEGRMMSRRKKLQLVFAVVLYVFFLVGCGGKAPATVAEPPTATSKPSLPAPTPVLPLSVTVTKDLVYANRLQPDIRGQVEWKLDLYAPAEPGDWPVVVFMHGENQAKEGWTTLPRAIAEQGAIVFVIEYPDIHQTVAILENGTGYREMADTVACAIRFARARVSDYGVDTPPVVISGFSLGGGVASQVALAGESVGRRWEEYAASRGGPPRQVDCEVSQGSTHVDALVGIAGAYDGFVGYDGKYGREFMQEKDPDLWKMLYGCIGENADLKVRLLHSEKDSVIPYENSVEFEATLAEAGYDVNLIQFSGGHSPPLGLTVQTVMNVARD
jgi:acetyl esterase/lipase